MIYDVVVVGAGSAGCVLATRLSEDPKRSVLLLEAGPDYADVAALPEDIRNSYVPAFSHDWGYRSELGKLGRALDLPRAKLVGGCSATNATIALRGTPGDYDEWTAEGNIGWSFSDVLPFFRRLENDLDFRNKWHGQTGPMPIRRFSKKELTSAQSAFLNTCYAAGHKQQDDLNAPDAIGAGPIPMNQLNGIRQSTALTYLAQSRHRRNLTVRSNALVDRVLFRGNRAVGVSIMSSPKKIFAQRIVLSAGSYSSPVILMRSGIGPAEHLRTLRIRVLIDLLGVGENLIDHPLFQLSFEAKPVRQTEEVPWAQTVLTLKSSKAWRYPDLQVLPTSITPSDIENSSGGADFNMLVSLVKPKSHGRLRLRSADPTAAPRIDLGYFTHRDDLPLMVEVVREARNLARTPPLSKLLRHELFPGPRITSISGLESTVLKTIGTYHHPVGTCRMGLAPDKGAVVDSHGNVHGVECLSVIDASIMPSIPAANTNIPTIMVAERCSEWLKQNSQLLLS